MLTFTINGTSYQLELATGRLYAHTGTCMTILATCHADLSKARYLKVTDDGFSLKSGGIKHSYSAASNRWTSKRKVA